jgi:hypothetical protein
MKPTLEFLKTIVDLAQNALDGSDGGVADRGSVEKQHKSGKIARDQNQLIDVLDGFSALWSS